MPRILLHLPELYVFNLFHAASSSFHASAWVSEKGARASPQPSPTAGPRCWPGGTKPSPAFAQPASPVTTGFGGLRGSSACAAVLRRCWKVRKTRGERTWSAVSAHGKGCALSSRNEKSRRGFMVRFPAEMSVRNYIQIANPPSPCN